ncbi:MAG: hypothetical protein ACRDQ7_12855 [Haloechinothrix sp.]
MRTNTARALGSTLAGFMLASLAAIGLSGVAAADEATQPTASGECAATVASGEGDQVTVDAGGPIGQVGVLDVGLGPTAKGTGGEADSTLVSLPVADAVESLGADDVPVVSDAVTEGCDAAKDTLNEAGGITQRVLSVDTLAAGPTVPEPVDPPADSGPADPGDEAAEDPGSVDGVADGQPAEPSVASLARPGTGLPQVAPLSIAELPMLQVPSAPDLNPDRGPEAGDTNTGRVDALPASEQWLPRVPLFLAVGLLAVVGAVLVRRWIARPRG